MEPRSRGEKGFEGVFHHGGRLFVWIADNAGRLPLLMRTELPIGAIVARLVEYQWPATPLPAGAAMTHRSGPRAN